MTVGNRLFSEDDVISSGPPPSGTKPTRENSRARLQRADRTGGMTLGHLEKPYISPT